MSDWNPREPDAWARILGLVSVPMFGAARAAQTMGNHAVMLDGRAGSFAWSIGEQTHAATYRHAVERAWSSNVLWSVSLTEDATEASVRSWDAPDEGQLWSVSDQENAHELFAFLRERTQPAGKTVIDRGVETFKAVRSAIENKGGSELDVVLAFNTLLAFVSSYGRSAGHEEANAKFASAARSFHRSGALGFSPDAISPSVKQYPLGDLARELLEGHHDGVPYLLDADLLVRHASGSLTQEAHKQLLAPSAPGSQKELDFANLIPARDRRRGEAPSYIHHTPPSLARALVEAVLRLAKLPTDRPPLVLDPACGSGVFLIEAIREITRFSDARPIQICGFDKSRIAVEMADFCVRSAVRSIDGTHPHSFSIEEHDSLSLMDWGSPDVVLMNPPFLSWENMNDAERMAVQAALGPAHNGRPDMAFAFIFRAIESLRPGGAMASVVPSSFLESKSAEILRTHISRSGQYRLHLLGQFRNFDYFDAVVQPAFIVISRDHRDSPLRIVLADESHEDDAVRFLRLLDHSKELVAPGCEIYNIEQHELTKRWTPPRQSDVQFVRAVTTNTLTTVCDFFIPRLGVRVGAKNVFMLTADELSAFCRTAREKHYFRPVADRVNKGIIEPSRYIFYPYSEDGELLLRTEPEVQRAVPEFYVERLRRAKKSLQARKSLYRNWWEVSEPVATWLARRAPRIVSQEFGRSTNFALDETGDFAVVQGFGWCWKSGEPDVATLLAYLAILSSRFFDRLLSCYCPRVRGQQYVLRRHFVQDVPLPNLENDDLRAILTGIGRSIADGVGREEREIDAQETVVALAFGLSSSGAPLRDGTKAEKRAERDFNSLLREWEEATAVYSFSGARLAHPAFRKIIALGRQAIPHILRRMKDDPSLWSEALVEITGSDPVPDEVTNLNAVAKTWLAWGRLHGFDV